MVKHFKLFIINIHCSEQVMSTILYLNTSVD